MTSEITLSNSSPLIALQQIGRLHLLQTLFASVHIPPPVAEEIAPTVTLPEWLIVRPLNLPLPPELLHAPLDRGERETLGLALEFQAHRVVLDDRPARKLA